MTPFYRTYLMFEDTALPMPQYSSAFGQVKFHFEAATVTPPLCAGLFSVKAPSYAVFTCSDNTGGSISNAGELRVYVRHDISKEGLACSYKKPVGGAALSITKIEIYEDAFLGIDLVFVLEQETASRS